MTVSRQCFVNPDHALFSSVWMLLNPVQYLHRSLPLDYQIGQGCSKESCDTCFGGYVHLEQFLLAKSSRWPRRHPSSSKIGKSSGKLLIRIAEPDGEIHRIDVAIVSSKVNRTFRIDCTS